MYFRNNTLQWKSKKKNQNITFGQIKILFLKISHFSGSQSLECQENDPLSVWVLVERNLRELLALCSLLAFVLSVDFTQPFSRLLLHSDGLSLFTLQYALRSSCCCVLSRVQLFATMWIVAHQAPLSVKFSSQEHWDGLWFLTPGDLRKLRLKPKSLTPALAGGVFLTAPPGKPLGSGIALLCKGPPSHGLLSTCLHFCLLLGVPFLHHFRYFSFCFSWLLII